MNFTVCISFFYTLAMSSHCTVSAVIVLSSYRGVFLLTLLTISLWLSFLQFSCVSLRAGHYGSHCDVPSVDRCKFFFSVLISSQKFSNVIFPNITPASFPFPPALQLHVSWAISVLILLDIYVLHAQVQNFASGWSKVQSFFNLY